MLIFLPFYLFPHLNKGTIFFSKLKFNDDIILKMYFQIKFKISQSLLSRETRRSDPSNGRLRREAAEPGDGGLLLRGSGGPGEHGGGSSGEVGPTESIKENCD